MMKHSKILSVLERYYENGWLDYWACGKYTPAARCSYGLLLYHDYYAGNFEPMQATDCSKIRVDGGRWQKLSEKALYHQHRYMAAFSAVPKEFRPIVRLVCIENKPVAAGVNQDDVTARRQAELIFSAKLDLCRGLDRLIDFYESYKHPDDNEG